MLLKKIETTKRKPEKHSLSCFFENGNKIFDMFQQIFGSIQSILKIILYNLFQNFEE